MMAGRLPWLCQGTTPPGCTTSLRRRSMRPSARACGSLARSTAPITLSDTLMAGVLFIGRTLGPDLSAGHDPANAAGAAGIANAAAAKNVFNCMVVISPVLGPLGPCEEDHPFPRLRNEMPMTYPFNAPRLSSQHGPRL